MLRATNLDSSMFVVLWFLRKGNFLGVIVLFWDITLLSLYFRIYVLASVSHALKMNFDLNFKLTHTLQVEGQIKTLFVVMTLFYRIL